MKTLWTGTDALFWSSFPKKYKKWWYIIAFRLFVRLTDFFCQEHYIVSEHLRPELRGLKKPIKVLVDPVLYPEKIEKVPHSGLIVGYFYKPGEFWEWIYGYDIIKQLEKEYQDIFWIKLDGGYRMEAMYDILDFYIRPNRHDGCPRMVMECKINDIPYYHSQVNPDINDIRHQLNELIQKKL